MSCFPLAAVFILPHILYWRTVIYFNMTTRVQLNTIKADGVNVFYRSAGPPTAPVLLLLHGFPSSSFQFRELDRKSVV